MEDCNICFSKISNFSEFKILGCNHKLCFKCYLHLQKNNCPYCRHQFVYSKEELIQRNKLNLNYNYTPPPQLFDLERFMNNNNFNSDIDINYNNYNRRTRQKMRRRRRNLTDEEIKERRNIIRNKCKRKWLLKEGRQFKLQWYNVIL